MLYLFYILLNHIKFTETIVSNLPYQAISSFKAWGALHDAVLAAHACCSANVGDRRFVLPIIVIVKSYDKHSHVDNNMMMVQMITIIL